MTQNWSNWRGRRVDAHNSEDEWVEVAHKELRFVYYLSFLFIMNFSQVAAMLLYRDKNRTNEFFKKVK